MTLAIEEPTTLRDPADHPHHDVLSRYVRDHGGTPTDALTVFEALEQFLVLCDETRRAQVPSEPVDNMWHTFILFTRDYSAYCQRHFGRFMHHQPGRTPEGAYASTRSELVSRFDSLDDLAWPSPEHNTRAKRLAGHEDCSNSSGHCPKRG